MGCIVKEGVRVCLGDRYVGRCDCLLECDLRKSPMRTLPNSNNSIKVAV